MKQKTVIDWTIDNVYIALGAAVYALGYTIFIRHNALTPGGINGIATQISALTDLPPGMLSLAMSIPLLVLGFWQLGSHFLLRPRSRPCCHLSLWIRLTYCSAVMRTRVKC